MPSCNACGADIVWRRNSKRKFVPVNIEDNDADIDVSELPLHFETCRKEKPKSYEAAKLAWQAREDDRETLNALKVLMEAFEYADVEYDVGHGGCNWQREDAEEEDEEE